jgi:hypothetical protein
MHCVNAERREGDKGMKGVLERGKRGRRAETRKKLFHVEFEREFLLETQHYGTVAD